MLSSDNQNNSSSSSNGSNKEFQRKESSVIEIILLWLFSMVNCLCGMFNKYNVSGKSNSSSVSSSSSAKHSEIQGGNALEGIYKPKEVNNPEKIYATLQECRDNVGIKKTDICKKSGYLYKRSEKNKKWKSMFFVLQMDGTDTHLLIFESPKVR